eukprot:g1246.t1
MCPVPGCEVEPTPAALQAVLTPDELTAYLTACVRFFLSEEGAVCCPVSSCGAIFELVTEASIAAALPYGGDLKAAQKAKDRVAWRAIMAANKERKKRVQLDKEEEKEEEEKDGEEKKEAKELSAEAAHHLASFRVRCGECKTSLCIGCLATPYHRGFTCESYRESLLGTTEAEDAEVSAGPQCRFCQQSLPGDDAHDDICWPAGGAAGEKKREDVEAAIVSRLVCDEVTCQDKAAMACWRRHECGHLCCGTRHDVVYGCPPCLDPACIEAARVKLQLEEEEEEAEQAKAEGDKDGGKDQQEEDEEGGKGNADDNDDDAWIRQIGEEEAPGGIVDMDPQLSARQRRNAKRRNRRRMKHAQRLALLNPGADAVVALGGGNNKLAGGEARVRRGLVKVLHHEKGDLCPICWLDDLGSAPCVVFPCGHVVHFACAEAFIMHEVNKMSKMHLSFDFLGCCLCRQPIGTAAGPVGALLAPFVDLEKQVRALAVTRMRQEDDWGNAWVVRGRGNHGKIKPVEPEAFERAVMHLAQDQSVTAIRPPAIADKLKLIRDDFDCSIGKFAMHTYVYFRCSKCREPYFGGLQACGAFQAPGPAAVRAPEDERHKGKKEVDDAEAKKDHGGDGGDGPGAAAEAAAAAPRNERHVCPSCATQALPLSSVICTDPGGHREFHIWKCRFCCRESVWFCFGTTHFCDKHHRIVNVKEHQVEPCPGPLKCPLRIAHPPNGISAESEHCMGCSVCAEKLTRDPAMIKMMNENEEKYLKDMQQRADAAAAARRREERKRAVLNFAFLGRYPMNGRRLLFGLLVGTALVFLESYHSGHSIEPFMRCGVALFFQKAFSIAAVICLGVCFAWTYQEFNRGVNVHLGVFQRARKALFEAGAAWGLLLFFHVCRWQIHARTSMRGGA